MKPTIQALRRMIEKAGGTLEEDEGFLNTRQFQAVAPKGKLWKCDDISCLSIHWERANPYPGQQDKYNTETLKDVEQRLSYGLRDMTEAEKFDYDYGCDDDTLIKDEAIQWAKQEGKI